MAALRLVLILLISVAGDLAVPPFQDSMDALEQSDDVLHQSMSRRPLRVIQAVSLPSPRLRVQAVSAPSVEGPPRPLLRHMQSRGGGRKIPPPVPDSASGSDDH